MRIGDAAGSEADQGAEEIVVLWFQIAAHGLADCEQADGIFGIADGEYLFEAGARADCSVKRSPIARVVTPRPRATCISHPCESRSGAADHEASHDGAKEVSKEVFRTEGRVEQFR